MFTYIFFFILVFLLLLPTILISFVKSILSIFGFNSGKKTNRTDKTHKNDTSYTKYETDSSNVKKHRRKKIFDKNDGEYVDFEEIK